jgi:hypothetical protein
MPLHRILEYFAKNRIVFNQVMCKLFIYNHNNDFVCKVSDLFVSEASP